MKPLKMKEMWLRASALFAVALLATVESHAQNVVTEWNSIASATIVAHGGNLPASSGVWFAYTGIAVYDAVNRIHRQFQPFSYKGRAPDDASEEAANRVLVKYFRRNKRRSMHKRGLRCPDLGAPGEKLAALRATESFQKETQHEKFSKMCRFQAF